MWQFAFCDDERYSAPTDPIEWAHRILVPFTPEANASGVGDTGFHKCCWYRGEFEAHSGEGRLILHFGAVDYAARVWIINIFVAEHEGGHTPFCADISHALRAEGVQVVTVQALDDPLWWRRSN